MKPTGWGAIVMGVYRPDPALLERQITSIARQSVSEWVCTIAVDDERRETTQLVRQLVADDSRFVIVENDANLGAYLNYERLLAAVDERAHWVAIADQDDYWYPNKLEVLRHSLESTGAPASVGRGLVKDTEGGAHGVTRRRPGDLTALLLLNQVSGGLMVLRGDVARSSVPFPAERPRALPDHWLAVWASAWGQIDFNSHVVQDYLQHPGNLIGESTLQPLIGTAVTSLQDASVIRALVMDTWRWRVVMAAELVARRPSSAGDKGVAAISRGGLSLALLSTVATRVARGDTPIRVAAALVTGATANEVMSRFRPA